jgi:hypothetical protein
MTTRKGALEAELLLRAAACGACRFFLTMLLIEELVSGSHACCWLEANM